MITVGKWRWPLVYLLPLIAASVLMWRGIVQPVYEGQGILVYGQPGHPTNVTPSLFQAHPEANIAFMKVPGHAQQVSVVVQASRSSRVVQRLKDVSRIWADRSLTEQRANLKRVEAALQTEVVLLDGRYNQQMQARKRYLAGSKGRGRMSEKMVILDRLMNETKVRRDYFTRRRRETIASEQSIKPLWTLIEPVQKPGWPKRVKGWPMGAGIVCGLFAAGFFLLKGEQKQEELAQDGLWRPEGPSELTRMDTLKEMQAPGPVQLEVVSPVENLPVDPRTEKATELYRKWVETAKILYTPAAEPPQGVLDQTAPLLEETNAFISEGHDVLTRYLAHSVAPGDLAAHVARTVLMTLTGAQEAGVEPDHRLAMALAALFHDLAVVARPEPLQSEVGSEVGRLSASVLRRIPGLDPSVLAMVEDILIGMDEFKLETWQNVANGSNLEPLSKVLREIDRFEKVMQKQKTRLEKRIANQ